MVFKYRGYDIEPAPLVTVSKEYILAGDGTKLSTNYNVSLTGSLLPNRGSPNSSGGLTAFSTSSPNADESFVTSETKFQAMLNKQQSMRVLFSSNGESLEWYPTAGQGIKFYPIINSINFDNGVWVDRCNYTVNMTTNKLFNHNGQPIEDTGDFNTFNIKSASDSFTLTEVNDGSETYQLSRTVSAVGFFQRNTAGTSTDPLTGTVSPAAAEPWEYAKQWVLSKVGSSYDLESAFKSVISTRTLQLPDLVGGGLGEDSYTAYSRNRSEQVDRKAGSYSLTDNWILAQSNALEDITITHETNNPYSNTSSEKHVLGVQSVYTVTGTITGLQSTTDGGYEGSKWDNALAYYNAQIIKTGTGNTKWENLIDRIADAFDLTASTLYTTLGSPESYSTTRNVRTGVISFQFRFTDKRLLNSNKFLNIQLNISENNHEQELAIIPIPGRAKGPIIQGIGTKTSTRRNVNATFTLMPSNTGTSNGIWRFSDLDGADGLRQEAVNILNGTTQNGVYRATPSGTQFNPSTALGDWWVTNFSDSLDPVAGTYNVSAVFTIKGTEKTGDYYTGGSTGFNGIGL
jgi:hypothetical protein